MMYVFKLSSATSSRTNCVVRLVVNSTFTGASNRTDIIANISFKQLSNAVGGAGAHSGGRLRFGPDGLLYVTTDDNHNQQLPQSPTLLGSKVLRVTNTGSAAPAMPFRRASTWGPAPGILRQPEYVRTSADGRGKARTYPC